MSDRLIAPALEPEEDVGSRNAWAVSTCFSTSVRRIDRVLTRIYDDAIRPSGLVTTQYALLSTLSRAPADLTLTQLATAIDLDRSTLSRNLDPLARQGFVRIAAAADRRARCVTITPAGLARLEVARPHWRSAQDHVAQLAGGQRIDAVLRELAELMDPVRLIREED